MSISKKKYVPMSLTVLGELSSQTLGGSNYLIDDGFSGMGNPAGDMGVDQGSGGITMMRL
ncbi:MAG: hypothetical protein RLZZ381_781 [Cyanobacteriota bacterium]|jgi:hypothetical protein